MRLYRIKLRPLSPWRTPWQADTLSGLLCCACARVSGGDVLRAEILEPALADRPPFVLSDAFPGDLLPLPTAARLADWPPADRARLKRARWLDPLAFATFQCTGSLAPGNLQDFQPVKEATSTHNTLDRISDATGPPGSLFSRREWLLARNFDHVSLYARVADGFLDPLVALLRALASTGFGADVSTGRGQFDLLGDPEPQDHLDAPPDGANGLIALSTFQPAPDDPADGLWEPIVKFGKLGPDFGIENVFKRPLILFRPGASFRSTAPRDFLGRAIPSTELLAPDTCHALAQRGIHPVHFAFGLTVPARLNL